MVSVYDASHMEISHSMGACPREAGEESERMTYYLNENCTDEELMEHACREPGCCNYRATGYVICLACLHGTARSLEPELAKRKKAIDRKKLKAEVSR